MSLLDTRADVLVLGDEALVTLHGELDLFSVTVVDAAVADAADATRVVLDLQDVTFVDGAALHHIDRLAKRLAEQGRILRMDNSSGLVRRLIHLMRLDDLRVR
jgi:anti-anti-sigma factor